MASHSVAHGAADGPKKIFGRENVNWQGAQKASADSSISGNGNDAISDFSYDDYDPIREEEIQDRILDNLTSGEGADTFRDSFTEAAYLQAVVVDEGDFDKWARSGESLPRTMLYDAQGSHEFVHVDDDTDEEVVNHDAIKSWTMRNKSELIDDYRNFKREDTKKTIDNILSGGESGDLGEAVSDYVDNYGGNLSVDQRISIISREGATDKDFRIAEKTSTMEYPFGKGMTRYYEKKAKVASPGSYEQKQAQHDAQNSRGMDELDSEMSHNPEFKQQMESMSVEVSSRNSSTMKVPAEFAEKFSHSDHPEVGMIHYMEQRMENNPVSNINTRIHDTSFNRDTNTITFRRLGN